MKQFGSILQNPLLVPVFVAWILAQFIKIFTHYFTKGTFDFQRFVGSGGMPSSHSSAVTCTATMAGLVAGFDSVEFAVALVFALVVMYDASGVRMAAGKQARVLNELVENYFHDHHLNQKKLKELIGHTPVEVFAGAILGTGVALIYYYWIYL